MVKSLPHETGQNASMQIPLEGQKISGCNVIFLPKRHYSNLIIMKNHQRDACPVKSLPCKYQQYRSLHIRKVQGRVQNALDQMKDILKIHNRMQSEILNWITVL